MEALALCYAWNADHSQSYIDTCNILELRCVRADFLHTMKDRFTKRLNDHKKEVSTYHANSIE